MRGRVPLNLFKSKSRRNRLINNPIVSGIVDVRRWLFRVKSTRLGKLPIVEGKVPSVVADSEAVIPMTLP